MIGSPIRRHCKLLLGAAAVSLLLSAEHAQGDVVVVANRTPWPIPFSVSDSSSATAKRSLKPGETTFVPCRGPATLTCAVGDKSLAYSLDANTANYFIPDKNENVTLERINLGGDPKTANGRPLSSRKPSTNAAVVKVKVLVDDDEPAARQIWERRLRQRIAAASSILERSCGVRLKIAGVDMWRSNNGAATLRELLADFEERASPQPAQVAIGFSGQRPENAARMHVGGTRGPLHTHILLHEWSPRLSESERLEMLIHELGHWLGAVHSPDPDSVMRPVYEDRLARLRGYRITFDPINALIINLFAEEMRERNIRSVSKLTPGTRTRLAQIYQTLARANPEDEATRAYAEKFDPLSGAMPVISGARKIIASIVEQAAANDRSGDDWTERCVRAAAQRAQQLPASTAKQSFLLGLGIALTDVGAVRASGVLQTLLDTVEPAELRQRRAALMRPAAMNGRPDLAQHFVASALLTTLAGPQTAYTAGLSKELRDAKGASGFSFPDLAADRAGIRFALGVLGGDVSLEELSVGFRVTDYVPYVADLPEGLPWSEYANQYVLHPQDRQREMVQKIDERIHSLPAYRGTPRSLP